MKMVFCTDLMCVIKSIFVKFVFSGTFVLDICENNNSNENTSDTDSNTKQSKFSRRIAIILHAILVLQTPSFGPLSRTRNIL